MLSFSKNNRYRCWKMNHRHRIALKIDHRRGLHAPDVCTLGRPCTSWRRSPWCTWLYPRSGRCSCCSRSSTWKHSLSGCQETVNRWLGDRCQVEQARETHLSPTWWEYPWSSLHTLLHSFVPHTTSPPILFYQMLYTSDYIFFPVFLAQVCLVANYTLHSHSLQSTFQRSPTCGKTDNRFKGTKYVEAGQQYKKLLSLVKTDPKCKKKTKSDGKPLISMPGECSPFDLYTF